jgi:hypothetical protein
VNGRKPVKELELLNAFLGVAVAFAGFAGVVALIDRRAAHVSHEVVSFRVRNLIVCVVIVMMLSVLPDVLLAFKFDPQRTWRIGCGAVAVLGVGYIFSVVRGRARLTGDLAQGLNTTQFNIMVPLGGIIILGVIVGAAGLVEASGMYLVGVFYFLLAIASYFHRLVMMLDEGARNSAQAPNSTQSKKL